MPIPALVAAVIVIGLLGVSGALTTIGPWYRDLRKPAWNPPDWVFAPAWTVILGLAGCSGVLAWLHAQDADDYLRIAILFGTNIVFYMLWTPLFFNLRRPDWALIEVILLWFSIVILMAELSPLSTLASWLLLPYLLWVTFAAFLNFTIVRMNPPFGPRTD